MILIAQVANAQLTQSSDPTFLIRLSIAPSIVDKEDPFPTFFVFITDSRGNPVLAPEDLEVSLVSSNSNIASVRSSVLIPKGEYYTTGKVETRGIGTTEIKASYSGQRVSSQITIVDISEASEEFSLAVRMPTSSMLTGTSMPFSVFLSDSEGRAVVSPVDIPLQVNYDQNLITLDIPRQIDAGSVYTIGKISSLQKSGNAWIKVSATGLEQQIATSVKVVADKPSSLSLKVVPSNITYFDRNFYLYAGLLDETGTPAKAEEDTIVRVFTNMTNNIVKEELLKDTLTFRIPKGNFGSFVNVPLEVRDQNTKGVFSFSAAAEGLQPAVTYLNLTLAKTNPTASLKPYVESVPKVGENTKLIASVQLKDVNGTIYTPPPGVKEVEAISSNLLALQVTKAGFFGGGQTFALIDLKSGFKSDEVKLVGAVPGYGSGNATISVVTKQPSKTVIFNPVTDIRFDSDNSSDLFVVLLDDSDRIVKAEKLTQFLLTPIGEIQSIASGESYAHFKFTRKQLTQSGNLTLTAIPVGVESDVDLESNMDAEVRYDSAATVQIIPAFREVISLKPIQNIIFVQLLDGVGNPYRVPTDAIVSLTPSDPDIVDVDQQVKIPKGSSYAPFTLYVGGFEGTSRINANAPNFASSSISIKAVSIPLPLSITPSIPNPETNRELTLTVKSEPGAQLTWKLPANVKVVSMDEQVSTDGTAELVIIPLTNEELLVDVEGSKLGYIRNKTTYTSNVESVIQNLSVQLIPYTDTIVPGTVSTVEVKVTDDTGRPVEGVDLEWDVTNAEVFSMSPRSDMDGSGTVEFMTNESQVNISIKASKNGFIDASASTTIGAEVVQVADNQEGEILQGIPETYLYLGLLGGIAAIASMRFVSMKKMSFKFPFKLGKSQQKDRENSIT